MEISSFNQPEDLEQTELAKLVVDMFHRIIIHHALWFTEIWHQMGQEQALKMLSEAFARSYGIQMGRLSKQLGFEMVEDVPAPLLQMPREQLMSLLDTVAVNWLANDGVWFQSVEFSQGMNDAKRCNDSCWARFSPYEAHAIRRFLHLSENPGLVGLKQALNFRLYARINRQSFIENGDKELIFQMNHCRVQFARKRKGLDDYPCKSGGLVEYTYFARTIDPRIRTECIGCPPDPHPEEWFCSWRFTL
jgi:hypothetical protein